MTLDWMVWTPPTAWFFVGIAALLVGHDGMAAGARPRCPGAASCR